jgi:YbbR domain-containing protein
MLFDNLFAKILALVVSVLLWFYVSEQQQFEERFSVPLRLENIPEDLTLLGEVPTEVEVLVRGQGRFLRHRVRGLVLAVDLSGAAEGRYIRRLTPADVTVPLEEDVEVLEIIAPGLLKAEIDRVTVRSVPVVPTTESVPARGYARVGSPVVNPEQVMIRGAESIVSSVNSLRTEPISLSGATRMVVARARVDLGGLTRVLCEPEQVAVALPVEKIESLTLSGVQVTVEADTTQWNVRWQPEEVGTVLEGPVSLMVGLRDAPPALNVKGEALTAGRYFFDLEIDRRGRITLSSREPEPVPPDSTDTTRVADAAPPPSEPITLRVSFDLPEGVRPSEVNPSRFHIVVEERVEGAPEQGEIVLPAS